MEKEAFFQILFRVAFLQRSQQVALGDHFPNKIRRSNSAKLLCRDPLPILSRLDSQLPFYGQDERSDGVGIFQNLCVPSGEFP